MSQNLNSAGKIAKIFINHPLTGILGIFILILGYFALQFMPKEENPQIKVSGAVVIVALPDAKASEIQKVIIEPLEKKIREKKVLNIFFLLLMIVMVLYKYNFLLGKIKRNQT